MNEIDGVVLGPEPEKTAYNHNSVEACVASGIVDPSKIAALLGFVNHEDPELLRQIDVEKVKLEIRLNDILLREAENGSVRAAIYLLQTIFNIARPAFVIAENVLGHVTMGLDEVLADMEDIGYAARAIIIPAAAVGADHRRDRVWIIANSKSGGLQRGNKRSSNAQSGRSRILTEPSGVCGGHIRGWTSKPTLVRGADGVSCGMDRHRIKSLGNAIVPQVAAELMRAAKCQRILDIKKMDKL